MDWNLYTSELKKQLEITKIKGRALSESVGRNFTYISQVLNGRVKKVDYETSKKIYEELNLIDIKLLDYYLYLLGVNLPILKIRELQNSTIFSNNLSIEQCYKSAWGSQDGATKDDTPHASDFYTDEEREEMDNLRMELGNEQRNYLSNYSWNKQQELKEVIKQINIKLNSYLEESFDPNNYSKNHTAEYELTTLGSLFDLDNKNTPPMFQFFLNLMHLPLQTITNSKTQNEILEFIKDKCILEYVFQGVEGMDNDPVEPNQLYLDYKQPLEK